MNSVCIITGDHPRHKYFAKHLIATGKVCSWIIEEREKFIPDPPNNIDSDLKNLFRHHFNERDRIESTIFGATESSQFEVPILRVSAENLNSRCSIEFAKMNNPSLIISYGCHKLKKIFLQSVAARFWNTHGGLSPDYRGVATHFWPSYFLEPQMTGMTLHETTEFIDGGEIIFQTSAPMIEGDTLHRLAARNVEVYVNTLATKLLELDFCNLPKGHRQKKYGKVFMGKDWRPEHLKLIYEIYQDKIVDAFLQGKIKGREPNLISVL